MSDSSAQTSSETNKISDSPAQTYSENDIQSLRKQFKFPEYLDQEVRLKTFDDWPKKKRQLPKQLSRAGFFYTHEGDRVTCFCCGCSVSGWRYRYDVYKQHSLQIYELNLRCGYLEMVYGEMNIEKDQNGYLWEIQVYQNKHKYDFLNKPLFLH